MPVPDYQAVMLPLMRSVADGKEHDVAELTDALASLLGLTEGERNELLPSGRQSKFDNRVGWARTYLKKAGLLESTGRGRLRITQRGLDLLATNPKELNSKSLTQFPEFVQFKAASRTGNRTQEMEEAGLSQTPEETLEASYQSLRADLAQQLLERAKTCSPRFFEKLVVDLLVAMGYGGSRRDAGEAVGRSGDGGIDGVIKEDKLGLDAVYVQAKRWEGTVGRPVVQAFAGSLEGQRARKGVIITTSQFSADAQDYTGRIEKKIVLIDGERLAELMIDHGIGVNEVESYAVKKLDLDYFGEVD